MLRNSTATENEEEVYAILSSNARAILEHSPRPTFVNLESNNPRARFTAQHFAVEIPLAYWCGHVQWEASTVELTLIDLTTTTTRGGGDTKKNSSNSSGNAIISISTQSPQQQQQQQHHKHRSRRHVVLQQHNAIIEQQHPPLRVANNNKYATTIKTKTNSNTFCSTSGDTIHLRFKLVDENNKYKKQAIQSSSTSSYASSSCDAIELSFSFDTAAEGTRPPNNKNKKRRSTTIATATATATNSNSNSSSSSSEYSSFLTLPKLHGSFGPFANLTDEIIKSNLMQLKELLGVNRKQPPSTVGCPYVVPPLDATAAADAYHHRKKPRLELKMEEEGYDTSNDSSSIITITGYDNDTDSDSMYYTKSPIITPATDPLREFFNVDALLLSDDSQGSSQLQSPPKAQPQEQQQQQPQLLQPLQQIPTVIRGGAENTPCLFSNSNASLGWFLLDVEPSEYHISSLSSSTPARLLGNFLPDTPLECVEIWIGNRVTTPTAMSASVIEFQIPPLPPLLDAFSSSSSSSSEVGGTAEDVVLRIRSSPGYEDNDDQDVFVKTVGRLSKRFQYITTTTTTSTTAAAARPQQAYLLPPHHQYNYLTQSTTVPLDSSITTTTTTTAAACNMASSSSSPPSSLHMLCAENKMSELLACLASSSSSSGSNDNSKDHLLIHQRDHNGQTPIFYALRNGHADLASVLATKYGARLDVLDNAMRTPLSYATVAVVDELNMLLVQQKKMIAEGGGGEEAEAEEEKKPEKVEVEKKNEEEYHHHYNNNNSSSSSSITTADPSDEITSSSSTTTNSDGNKEEIKTALEVLSRCIAIHGREARAFMTKQEWLKQGGNARLLKMVSDFLVRHGFIQAWSRSAPKVRRNCLPPYSNIGSIYDALKAQMTITTTTTTTTSQHHYPRNQQQQQQQHKH